MAEPVSDPHHQELDLFRIKVYPNPVNASLYLHWESALNSPLNVSIISVDGSVVRRIETGTLTQPVIMDVGALSPGMYFIRLESSSGISLEKFVKH